MSFPSHDPYDDGVDYEPTEPPRRRRGRSFIIVMVLAMVGVGSAFAWRAAGGGGIQRFFTSTAAAPSVAPEDKSVGLKDLQGVQQKLAGQLQTVTQLITAQQVQIKGLADQVAALAGKLDKLQPPPPAPAVHIPAVPNPRPARKKPAAPKPVEASPAPLSPPPGAPIQLGR